MSQVPLNNVFTTLTCSLLQYVGENSPWIATTDEHAVEQLHTIVKLQQGQIQRLADFLVNRYGFVPHESYPAEFTDLQYLALTYLLDKLVSDQKSVAETLEHERQQLNGDPGASDLLSQIEVGIARTIQSLEGLDSQLTTQEAL